MKSLLNITPPILFAAALMQLYRIDMELKYNYEALAWQMINKTGQLDLIDATLFRRSDQHTQKTSDGARPGQLPLDSRAVSSRGTQ